MKKKTKTKVFTFFYILLFIVITTAWIIFYTMFESLIVVVKEHILRIKATRSSGILKK